MAASAFTPLSNFYPRPPRGGRQKGQSSPGSGPAISIHALREEGDDTAVGASLYNLDFYPRPPRGGRPAAATRPARDTSISIHALREEGDHAAHKL